MNVYIVYQTTSVWCSEYWIIAVEKEALVDTDGINTKGQREKAKEREDNPPSSQTKESCYPRMCACIVHNII